MRRPRIRCDLRKASVGPGASGNADSRGTIGMPLTRWGGRLSTLPFIKWRADDRAERQCHMQIKSPRSRRNGSPIVTPQNARDAGHGSKTQNDSPKDVVSRRRIGSDRIECDIAEIEYPASPTTTSGPTQHHVGQHHDAEVENVRGS